MGNATGGLRVELLVSNFVGGRQQKESKGKEVPRYRSTVAADLPLRSSQIANPASAKSKFTSC